VLLSVKQLTVNFPIRKGILQRIKGFTKAVDHVDFTLYKGQTLALVGESGCGKTTIGKALVALNKITSGELIYHDKDQKTVISVLDQSGFKPWRRKIQMVFQDPYSSMNPRMTVRHIIEEGMLALAVESDPVKRHIEMEWLLERVGLEAEHMDRYIHEFSGGQRQRIALARALAVKPELLICDEPTSALDVSIRGQVLRLLKKLQDEEGLSYLFITHDLSIVPHLAHQVAVMKEGVIVESGATKQIMTHPQHDYTKTLLAAAPHLPPNRFS
jgi:peptide/nickel transport system ATP-binding protein